MAHHDLGHGWDRGMTGPHRGRGPRGYRRSDERIREDLHERLTDDPRLDASDIEVRVEVGVVTLDGTVDDRDARHRAEDLAEAVLGVSHVQNNLRLRSRSGQRDDDRHARPARQEPFGDATNYPRGTVGTGNLARE